MSHKVNLVRVLTAATGNSTPITLGAAYSQLFMLPSEAGAMDGRVYTYLIVDGNNWELGKGVYTASGTSLARTTIIASRISGTLGTSRITLSGTAQVRFIESAEDMDGVRGTRAVTGTSDTLNNSDLGYAVTYSNASAVAVSLAQASVSNLFLDGWAVWVKNKGAGAVTITPATSTIALQSTLQLKQNQGALIWSDGTNYDAFVFGDDGRLARADARGDFAGMSNGTLVASASAGALTVAVKTLAGVDPSAGDPVYFYFRNATLTLGGFDRIAVTSALSLVLGSTKTLGAANASALRVWIGAFNNAGTVQLAAINCSDSSGVFSPQEYAKYTTAVPANGAKTFYSTSAIGTASPWRLLGFCEWTSLTTAGTWVGPDIIQLFGPGVDRPGKVVQSTRNPSGTSATGTATMPITTQPQITDGTEFIAHAIAPSSGANKLRVRTLGQFQTSAGTTVIIAALFRDAAANALAATSFYPNASINSEASALLETLVSAVSATVTTFRLRAGANSASTTTFNPRFGNTVSNSFIEIEEIQG